MSCVFYPQVSSSTVSHQDQEILTYITTIGCSLSLVALVITVVLFVTNRSFILPRFTFHLSSHIFLEQQPPFVLAPFTCSLRQASLC